MKLPPLLRRHSLKLGGFRALVRRGDGANAARRWDEAHDAYAAALRLEPDHAWLWVQFGHASKEQGFLGQAEQAYQRAIKLSPTEADTHLQLGHLLRLRGEYARAIAAYQAAHRLQPDMRDGQVELADLSVTTDLPLIEADSHLDAAIAAGATAARAVASPVIRETMSLQAIVAAYDLSPDLLDRFDPYFYFQAHPTVQAELPDSSKRGCLVHFCTTGLGLGLPISVDDRFDARFYRETYLGSAPFTPANAYRHWLGVGLRAGFAPNPDRWLQSRLGDPSVRLDAEQLAMFDARMPEADRPVSWTARALRFIDAAAGPDRPTVASAGLLAAVAGRLDTEGPAARLRGFALRQRIAWAVPDHAANNAVLAQTLIANGDLAGAASILQREVAGGGDASKLSYLRLSECLAGLEFPHEALTVLRAAQRRYPDDIYLGRRAAEMAQRRFDQDWSTALALARRGRLAEGQALVRDACVPPAEQAPLAQAREIRSIALVGHFPLPQCRFYRLDQKVGQLEDAGYHVEVFDLGVDAPSFGRRMHLFEAVIFFRVPALPHVSAAIQAATRLGLATFYDIDDQIFADPYPGSLASYAGRIDTEAYFGLALAVPLFDQAMRLCQYGISSTETLADAMRGRVRSGQVFVHPNGLGARHLAFAEAAGPALAVPGQTVTIFHGSGTKAHKEDFQTLVEPALVEMVRRHGRRIAIVLMGDFAESPGLAAIADNVTLLPPVWTIEAYWSLLAGADINLAVLEPSPLTDAKSEIKWLEAAMLGIPSVVSATATYRAVVRPDETGIICRTPADWTRALDRLVRDPALRTRLGDAARTQALAEYGPQALNTRISAMLAQVSPPPDPRPLIVVVNVFYPPQAIGGATRVVHDNVRDLVALAGDRYRVEVFTTIHGGDAYVTSSHVEDGVRVTGVGTPDHPALERRAVDPRMGEIFGAYLDHARPAVVHFHCLQRLTVAIVTATAVRRIPYLISVHDGWWISDQQFLVNDAGVVETYDPALFGDLRRADMLARIPLGPPDRLVPLARALAGARQVLAVSEPFAAIYRGCGVARVVSVANGVSAFAPATRLSADDGRVRLGFIGGLSRHKGFDLIRIALSARPYANLRLLLIDHAMECGEVRHELWGSIEVEFRPKWPQTDVAGLYAQIDVLLAPSLWPESFGLVTREALMSGCWVVASDRGSIGECVADGQNGFVVDVTTSDGLARAFDAIDRDPARYRASPPAPGPMRSARDQAAELVGVYDQVIKQRLLL